MLVHSYEIQYHNIQLNVTLWFLQRVRECSGWWRCRTGTEGVNLLQSSLIPCGALGALWGSIPLEWNANLCDCVQGLAPGLSHTLTHMHTREHTHSHTHLHTRTHTHTHIQTHTNSLFHMCRHMSTHTHIHIQTHTQTQIQYTVVQKPTAVITVL